MEPLENHKPRVRNAQYKPPIFVGVIAEATMVLVVDRHCAQCSVVYSVVTILV